MKVTKFMILTMKEDPAEATVASHILMLRAGLIRKLSSGLYSFLPLGLRAMRKMENIVRREMDRANGQEFRLPLILTKEMWEASGRYSAMGDLMMKVKDRGGNDFVLAPTHEEAFTDLIKNELQSYKQLPFTVYQIGNKYRDEIRPRFGIMRSREFVMKDAYSFNLNEQCLDESYKEMQDAYKRIFSSCGLKTVSVKADSGAMGGTGSEEFMVPSDVGEDEIINCEKCGYTANVETAICGDLLSASAKSDAVIEKVSTPDVKTIEQLAEFFKCEKNRFIKSMLYVDGENSETPPVLVLMRGDLEINEVKLANVTSFVLPILADDAVVQKTVGSEVGFVGPVGLKGVKVIADKSIEIMVDCFSGANEKDYHFKNIQPGRDFSPESYVDLRLVKTGASCSECGAKLKSFRGIEVGHLFKLGDKYTKALGTEYLDENGKRAFPLMGCYGIGVGRTLASVIEQNRDDKGIIWPMSLAPFEVLIIPLNYKDEALKKVADDLHEKLQTVGVDPLLDDRKARAGVKFKDAELIGIPISITIGNRGIESGELELKIRGREEGLSVPIDQVVEKVLQLKDELLQGITSNLK